MRYAFSVAILTGLGLSCHVRHAGADAISSAERKRTVGNWAGTLKNGAAQAVSTSVKATDRHLEDTDYWSIYLQESMDSMTLTPSEVPSESPSETPSATPSAPPSAAPSPAPSSTPSAPPSAAPSPAPSSIPSATPSAPPSAIPSSTPSAPPSAAPSAPPSAAPSAAPSPAPSAAPTGLCEIDLTLTCEAQDGFDTNCQLLRGEEDLTCSCPECVRELILIYTADPCDPVSETCMDTPGPSGTAFLVITASDDEDVIFFSGDVAEGDEVVVGDDNACLPDSVKATVRPSSDSEGAIQMVTLDTSCDGRGLFLLQGYGALDFIGYTCEEDDVHNCFIDVLYNITSCNVGEVDLILAELEFTLNNVTTDLIPSIPEDELLLTKDMCIAVFQNSVVERCSDDVEFCATSEVEAETIVAGGPRCEDEDELKFNLEVGSLQPSPAPSAAPSATPSAPPSAIPSSTPSAPPSAAPSAPPSATPSAPPSATPSTTPSAAPSAPPSATPSAIPSAAPSSVPSGTPSAAPSSAPSPAPSAAPSETPSMSPSESPSESPSSAPSPAPSAAPSTAPSPAPSETCVLEIDLDCVPSDPRLGTDCESIPIFTQICEDRPFEMSFRYNGGDCSQSFNIQPRSLFTCQDFNGGPPTEQNATTYIQAFELNGGEMYFEGFVNVGNLFTLTTEEEGDTVSANMNISMWDPRGSTNPAEIVQGANLLQTVKYHSSCSRNLFLKDRFGSAQLVEFISPDQGLVTCFVTANLALDILIPIQTDGDSVRLKSLEIATNSFGIFNRTDEVNGMVVMGGDVVMVSPLNVSLDLTNRQRYTFFTVVIGETLNGDSECFGQDFFEFTAGNPLPPIFPTMAPSSSPTMSPFPTPDPEDTPCGLMADVTCAVIEGPTSQACQELSEPLIKQCRGPDVTLTNLRFRYTAGTCGNTGDCVDFDLDMSRTTVVVQVSDNDGDYFDAVVNELDFFDVTNPSGFSRRNIAVFIFEYDPTQENNIGSIIQRQSIDTECEDPGVGVDAELILGNEYGGVTLAEFENDQDGVQSNFAEVQITYTVSNPSVFEAFLNSAVVSSFFSGVGQQLITRPRFFTRNQVSDVLVESEILDLALVASNPTNFYIFGINIRGTSDTVAASTCLNFGQFTFSVAAAP
eukprot:CAMPEP_0117077738 /NCGR_PEP_ID=MMETSP0472-20121206/54796_1 /TAXON_ID=693140 ORGANISM="Tiarina fusus, Strain LIS" /NCGR_SAMPLE_ID=MMETSP0472 /ASSEMBLY_ACC=CAM_ASM_000603 /LENGTH=1142 /DNA_ID=CAMNT_0004804163 /DNA_START=45 /DNA_END=3473 /DNA_ORIENTATION=-